MWCRVSFGLSTVFSWAIIWSSFQTRSVPSLARFKYVDILYRTLSCACGRLYAWNFTRSCDHTRSAMKMCCCDDIYIYIYIYVCVSVVGQFDWHVLAASTISSKKGPPRHEQHRERYYRVMASSIKTIECNQNRYLSIYLSIYIYMIRAKRLIIVRRPRLWLDGGTLISTRDISERFSIPAPQHASIYIILWTTTSTRVIMGHNF
jgi:hypothetical protein